MQVWAAAGGTEVLVVEAFTLLGVVVQVVFAMCRKSFIRVCLKDCIIFSLVGGPSQSMVHVHVYVNLYRHPFLRLESVWGRLSFQSSGDQLLWMGKH